MLYRLSLIWIVMLVSILLARAQSASPGRVVPRPKAIYTPVPEYRAEWARQGLTGKGVVLITIDKETGKVTGARMLQSTGSKVLDGSALEAYSKWRFEPGTAVPQLKMPIEFTNRSPPQSAKQTPSQPTVLYFVFIVLGLGAVLAFFKVFNRPGDR